MPVKVIQKMSGLKIGHFVGMDFAGFERMVDTVGGVNVCSPGPIEDGILGTVLASGGTQMLDGRTALNYVRARHVEAEATATTGASPVSRSSCLRCSARPCPTRSS